MLILATWGLSILIPRPQSIEAWVRGRRLPAAESQHEIDSILRCEVDGCFACPVRPPQPRAASQEERGAPQEIDLSPGPLELPAGIHRRYRRRPHEE